MLSTRQRTRPNFHSDVTDPHHVLYSLFWGNDALDVVVVSIAGTTKNLWNTYSPVFDKMSGFELIDMKRFDK